MKKPPHHSAHRPKSPPRPERMEQLKFGNSIYRFSAKLGESNIPRRVLVPDALCMLLTVCRHLAIISDKHSAAMTAVGDVHACRAVAPLRLAR